MEHKILKNSKKSKNIKKNDTKLSLNTQNTEYELINFYLQPEFIQMISQQLAEQPKVNTVKVNQIKQTIENNNYAINPLEVAEKIINFETELFK